MLEYGDNKRMMNLFRFFIHRCYERRSILPAVADNNFGHSLR